jgi:hypothetical protein
MVLLGHAGKDIQSFLINFNLVLVSHLTQTALHLLIECPQLFVEVLFLSKSTLEHADLVTQLVVLKLVLVSFPPYLLIAFLSQFSEFTLLPLLQHCNNISCLIQLKSQVFYQRVLILTLPLSISL